MNDINREVYVNHDGIKIYLTQDAYLNGCYDDPHYCAHGLDENENEYTVRWELLYTLKEIEELEIEDEGQVCDWDIFTVTNN